MRLKFWIWAHRKAEQVWHWIYFERLGPLGYHPKPIMREKDEVKRG